VTHASDPHVPGQIKPAKGAAALGTAHYAALFVYSGFCFGATMFHIVTSGEINDWDALMCTSVPPWLRAVSMSFTLSKIWEVRGWWGGVGGGFAPHARAYVCAPVGKSGVRSRALPPSLPSHPPPLAPTSLSLQPTALVVLGLLRMGGGWGYYGVEELALRSLVLPAPLSIGPPAHRPPPPPLSL
jgi:hypothetical protein